MAADDDDDYPCTGGGWNYRVVKKLYAGEYYYQIHEVYYDKEGRVTMATVEAITVSAESHKVLGEILELMRIAWTKPVLDYDTDIPQGDAVDLS